VNNPVVCVFAKMWDCGPVKTRLAADIGEQKARTVYRQVAEQVWSQLESTEFQRWLWMVDNDVCNKAGKWLHGADKVLPQVDGNLGQRIHHAMKIALDSGARWCAVVGTDAPAVNSKMLQEAETLLFKKEAPDIVLTPAYDGGYAMIAGRITAKELFTEIEWSTPRVLAQTLERIEKLNLTGHLLQKVHDLDTLEDLRKLEKSKIFPT